MLTSEVMLSPLDSKYSLTLADKHDVNRSFIVTFYALAANLTSPNKKSRLDAQIFLPESSLFPSWNGFFLIVNPLIKNLQKSEGRWKGTLNLSNSFSIHEIFFIVINAEGSYVSPKARMKEIIEAPSAKL